MNYFKFTNPDGTTDCFVNLDAFCSAKPGDDGKIILQSPETSLCVDAKQFEAAVARRKPADVYSGILNRLIQAIERLTVRIPTSIRLHM
jgi:hypothetical protein